MSLNSPFTSQPQTSHNQKTNTKTTAVAFNTFPGNGLVFFTFCCYFLFCLDFSPAPIPPRDGGAVGEVAALWGAGPTPRLPAPLHSAAGHSVEQCSALALPGLYGI